MNQTKFKYRNKLIDEKSPYLLQHAHNPVNWFPWGEEAFELARKENKPIFLSIGYSTCHWCHVMEHESFEDEEVAKAMNEVFISIKVDREERPDIDNIYMSVCQMLTGSGGWAMTIIMTPDKKPFFAGTYFPKNSFSNRMGMIELIAKIDEAWKNQRKEIDESAENIVSHLNSVNNIISKEFTNEGVIDTAFRDFSNRFDEKLGGFGNRPKFPSPHNLSFLLRYYDKTKNESAKFMVEKTLTEMRKGG
ncbi:MAG: thioredoxin domain-containing protein, partial [Ignavibacteriae bacterium]|nr:thioredoxin domain-containing protein [Ignavibacteriota bacterium]